jgi:hypothetical protein
MSNSKTSHSIALRKESSAATKKRKKDDGMRLITVFLTAENFDKWSKIKEKEKTINHLIAKLIL